jgi:YcxB-like protein
VPGTVTFRFRLTEQEYFQYNYYTAWAAPSKKRFRFIYFVRVIVLYAAVAFLYIISSRSHIIWLDISVFLVTGTLYLIFIPSFIRWSVHRRVKNILGNKENAHVLDISEVILSDTGITDRDIVSESKYDWEAIVQFADTDSAWYLYTNSHHAIVIPKRTAENAGDVKEAERLFAVHLPLDA